MNGKVSLTKGALLRLRDELTLAEEAHDLLDRKREVLINELMAVIHDLHDLQERFHDEYREVLEKLRIARLKMGDERMSLASSFAPEAPEIEALDRSVMGVHVFELSAVSFPRPPRSGPALAAGEYEEAAGRMGGIMALLLRYVSHTHAAWRLATEVRKAQRRVNALETIFIPNYRKTINEVQSALEENEREEFSRLKRIKRKRARAASAAGSGPPD